MAPPVNRRPGNVHIEAAQAELLNRWPARKQQIAQIMRLVGRPQQSGTDMLVYGAPKTGKTSIVRAVLAALDRDFAYFEVGETTKPKQLFSSVLSQLHAMKRKRENGYAGSTSDSVVEFVNELGKACPADKPTAFIVLDGSQLLARGQLLTAMMQAREVAGANVSWVLISSVPWSSQWYFEGCVRGVLPQVHFPAYTEQELVRIMTQDAQHVVSSSPASRWDEPPSQPVPPDVLTQLYPHFISAVVCSHVMPVTRSVCDLRAVATSLWPHYIHPLGRDVAPSLPLETLVRRLSGAIKPRVQLVLQALQPGMTHAQLIDAAILQLRGISQVAGRSGDGGPGSHNHHTHDWGALPPAARLLVVAGFIAAHNKASHDKQVFDAGTRAGRIRGGGKAALEADRQMDAAKEARLKGPSPFSLTRLLTIYQFLYLAADHCGSGQQAAVQQMRVQGLHALKPSFVITAATLQSMDRLDRGDEQGAGAGQAGKGSKGKGTGGVQQGGDRERRDADMSTRDHQQQQQEDEAAELRRLLQQAQQAQQSGRSGRTKVKKSSSPAAHKVVQASLAGEVQGGREAGGKGLVRLEGACAQLPHPASGAPQHGRLPMSPDMAPLLHNITALTSMGLLKRAAADDMLEAPRLLLGCVDEALAAELARDCGLKLGDYLKYA